MRLLLLGTGKTGSLVGDVARERGHHVDTLRSSENPNAGALTRDRLSPFDCVIDFTTPHCVLDHIRACTEAGKNMVVGTTGWHSELASVRGLVEKHGTGFLYGSNFSIGVNLFFDLVRTAVPAIKQGYLPHIYERHHAGAEVEITSFREGEVVGMHELTLDSPQDEIYLCHDAKSRRGFAEGAVRGAEWLCGRKGFFEFRDVWREMR